jgi:hypothetical protein
MGCAWFFDLGALHPLEDTTRLQPVVLQFLSFWCGNILTLKRAYEAAQKLKYHRLKPGGVPKDQCPVH